MKRLCGILLALAGLFLYAPCAAQNTRVRGTVTDAQTGEPIPYAVVLFPGTTTGITTDDEGFYSLESRDTSSYIRAEMVSYEASDTSGPRPGATTKSTSGSLLRIWKSQSVVITPGDNPAHPILEGIIRNQKIQRLQGVRPLHLPHLYENGTRTGQYPGIPEPKNSNRISVSSSST